mmetsp:Transcript_16454/g.56228  ORF Transcript_16454/g.56228 Transcript_16454/m.56228 type:complete len:255 (+) Transcript_16454:821-1585(+)
MTGASTICVGNAPPWKKNSTAPSSTPKSTTNSKWSSRNGLCSTRLLQCTYGRVLCKSRNSTASPRRRWTPTLGFHIQKKRSTRPGSTTVVIHMNHSRIRIRRMCTNTLPSNPPPRPQTPKNSKKPTTTPSEHTSRGIWRTRTRRRARPRRRATRTKPHRPRPRATRTRRPTPPATPTILRPSTPPRRRPPRPRPRPRPKTLRLRLQNPHDALPPKPSPPSPGATSRRRTLATPQRQRRRRGRKGIRARNITLLA